MKRSAQAMAWLLPFGLLVISIISVPRAILEEQGLPRYRALRAEVHEINRDNARLRREARQLRLEVEALQHEASAVERIARDQLGMIRADEILFQFPD